MKKPSIFSLAAIVFSICALPAFGQTAAPKRETINRANLKLTDEDKRSIIKSLFEKLSQIKKQMSPETVRKNLVIKLSDKNIDANLLPEFPNVEFVLLNTDDIKNYKGAELTYWEIEKFEYHGYNVMVSFTTSNLARGFFPGKSSSTYEYYKINGKWLNRWMGGYIAN